MIIRKAHGEAAGTPAAAPATRASSEMSVAPVEESLRRRAIDLDRQPSAERWSDSREGAMELAEEAVIVAP